MNPERMTQRKLQFRSLQVGFLHGYRLVFNKISRRHPDCGHANIVPASESIVEGILYRLEGCRELDKMDPFEHAPVDYRRQVVRVETRSSRIRATTYIATPGHTNDELKPPKWYFEHLLASKHRLSSSYLDYLHKIADIPKID